MASKNSEEEFLNGTEMENEKTNKNKRAETFGGKLILNKLRKTQYTKIPRKGNREEATAVAKVHHNLAGSFLINFVDQTLDVLPSLYRSKEKVPISFRILNHS